MSVDVATAKQRHREAVFARYRRPQCALKDRHACSGRLESDHVIEVRWIEAEWRRVRERARTPGRVEASPLLACARCHGDGEVAVNPGYPDPRTEDSARCPVCHGTGEGSLDELIADGRNGWILCAAANQLKYRRLIQIDRHELPPSVEDFASEFQIEHLLDRYFGGSR